MSVTSEDEVVHPPSKLGEYTVVQEIGEGTFGKVKSKHPVDPAAFRLSPSNPPVAVHTITGHKVAMKYISKQVINATKTKTRVQREVEYMRMLRHPHIIKLYVLPTLHPTAPLHSETLTPIQIRSDLHPHRHHHRPRIRRWRTVRVHRRKWTYV